MKKIVSLVLALLLSLSVLALADPSAPLFDELTTITILSRNGSQSDATVTELDWYMNLLKENNIDMKIEQIDYAAYDDVAQPRLAAGENLPDIMCISGNESKLAASGNFIALNEYIEQYGDNIKNWFEKYPNLEGALKAADGNIYFMPYLYTTSGNCRTMMINVLYLEKLGMTIDDIKTLDDLYNFLTLVKENDMNGDGNTDDEIPLFVRGGYFLPMSMYFCVDIDNVGGFPIDENGNVYCGYVTDEFKEFLEWAKMLYDEGLMNPDFLSADYDQQTAEFTDNNIGCIFHYVSNATEYAQTINPAFDNYTGIPAMQIIALENKDGQPVTYGRGIIGHKFGISKDCKDPEAAFKFLDYCYSEEFGLRTWYGSENVEYTLENGEFKFNDIYYDTPYLDDMGYNCDYFPGYQYDYSAKQCPFIFKQTMALNDYVWNPSRMAKSMTDDQIDVINTYSTDLNTYFSENYAAFVLGTKSFDEWDAYVAGAYEMGLQNVIDVYQELED